MQTFSSFDHLADSIGGTIRAGGRFPVEIALGVATAIVTSLGISDSTEWGTFSLEFFMTVLPTLIGVFATSALYELGILDAPRRWGLTAAYLLGGLGYGIFVLDSALIAETWRWFYLTSALSLGAMLTPLAARPDGLNRRELTWRFNLRFGSRLITSGAYT